MEVTLPSGAALPRVLVFGSECHFTTELLERMLNAGIPVVGLLLPGMPGVSRPLTVPARRALVPLAGKQSAGSGVVDNAHSHSIPVFRIGRVGSPEALSIIRDLGARVLLSVCYPRLIPGKVRKLFPGLALNVHTSLLPALRGPDPMFWTFRRGDGPSGVTIHHLTSEVDGGPIAAQRVVDYADGTTERELESQLAAAANELMLELLGYAAAGRALPASPQHEDAASWAPFPTDDDFHLNAGLSARAAYNFVHGVRERQVPITVDHDGKRQVIIAAVDYGPEPSIDQNAENRQAVRFADGYLIAQLAPARS